MRQLNANLAALGYLAPGAATSDVYGSATEAAVRRLQQARGAVPTGIVPLGSIVFVPGAMRVGVVAATHRPDRRAGRSAAAHGLGQARRHRRSLGGRPGQRACRRPGLDRASERARRRTGVVSEIARVATPPDASADGQGGAGHRAASTATVTVTVRLRDARVAPALDEAPVQVAITTASTPDALAVPVGALLAQADGRYAVQVVRAGRRATVRVTTGLFSDSTDLVAITSGALRVGDRVVVPA